MLESYLISVAVKSTVLLAAGPLCLRFLRAARCGAAAFGLSGGAGKRGCGAVPGALVPALELSHFCSSGASRRSGGEHFGNQAVELAD